MTTRLVTLKRLVSLYEAIERTHLIKLQLSAAALLEAEQAVYIQQNLVCMARKNGHEALMGDDRLRWLTSEIQADTLAWTRRRLDLISEERKAMKARAREHHLVSRMKSEQMKQVTQRIVAKIQAEDIRRLQAASDDRFLARTRFARAEIINLL